MDIGSTKRAVERAMEDLPIQFAAIGGHPMCGRESSGLTAASADLFAGQTFILCRNRRTTLVIEEVAMMLVANIGARPHLMPADEHDALVATTSHLPYVVSATLMSRAWHRAAEDQRLWDVSASGLRDTTRLAGSNPEMMVEIMLTNQRALSAEIEAYAQELAAMAEALRTRNRQVLQGKLAEARDYRRDYLRAKYGHDQATADGSEK
jgi:prephenate dehydrogenase